MIELSSVNLAIIEIIPGGAGPMSIILATSQADEIVGTSACNKLAVSNL